MATSAINVACQPWIPGGIKTSRHGELQFVSTDQHSSTAEFLKVLQQLEVVISFDGVSNDGRQSLQSLCISFVIASQLLLGVEIERPRVSDFGHDVSNPPVLAVQVTVGTSLQNQTTHCVSRFSDSVFQSTKIALWGENCVSLPLPIVLTVRKRELNDTKVC